MRPDLVLIICDTARADAFSPWGGSETTPNIDRLCREGTTYAEAYAQAPWTVPSTASILTGVLPTQHGVTGEAIHWIGRRPTSPKPAVDAFEDGWLTDLLRERGYRTWAASANSWVSRWGGFDRGFDTFLDVRGWARQRGPVHAAGHRLRKALGLTDRGGAEAAREFASFLAAAGSEPNFCFVNLMETHPPLDPPRARYPFSAWRRFRTRKLTGGPDQGLSYNVGARTPAAGYIETITELYRACAVYEDDILGRFVATVVRHSRPTIIVILADHGEHLGEHGLFGHNSSLHREVLHVPLVAWGQGLDAAGGRIDEPVSLLGIARALLAVADGGSWRLPIEDAVISEYEGTARHHGIPDDIQQALDRLVPSDVPALIMQPGLAIRRGKLKYTVSGAGTETLFDLAIDPTEGSNLLGTGESAEPFLEDRRAWEARAMFRPTSAEGTRAEDEIAEHLRTLGYLE